MIRVLTQESPNLSLASIPGAKYKVTMGHWPAGGLLYSNTEPLIREANDTFSVPLIMKGSDTLESIIDRRKRENQVPQEFQFQTEWEEWDQWFMKMVWWEITVV